MNEITKKAESVALAGSFMGIVVAAIVQEVLFAAVPLTITLALNSFNRNQFEKKLENSINQQNQPQLANIEDINQESKQQFIRLNQRVNQESTKESVTAQGESAVFWDYENVKVAMDYGLKAPLAESLTEYSVSLGNPRVKKVYSDWQREKKHLVQALYSLGFETVHVAMGKENSVDVKLAVDCIAAAYQYTSIQQFIIVAADRDYVPLINRLKMLGKKVTLIGWSAAASEHLLLSADEFIDMEELNSDDQSVDMDSEVASSQKISYENAVNYLIETINDARLKQKSTRIETIASLMRMNPQIPYQEISSIVKDDGTNFASFGAFVRAAEKEGKVKVETIEGFKEIFLPEEDPESESEFGSQDPNKLTQNEWLIIIEQVRQAMQKENPKQNKYGRFGLLIQYITRAKKDGRLSQSHRQIKFALIKLIDVGVLIEQPDKSYRLVEGLDRELQHFLHELMTH